MNNTRASPSNLRWDIHQGAEVGASFADRQRNIFGRGPVVREGLIVEVRVAALGPARPALVGLAGDFKAVDLMLLADLVLVQQRIVEAES